MTHKTRILFVCLGNICRSAAAEAVMKKLAKEAGIIGSLVIDSAGILSCHQGEAADPRMRMAAERRGYCVDSLSRPVTAADFLHYDLILGMDDDNVEWLLDHAACAGQRAKVRPMAGYLLRHTDGFIPDPYYGGPEGFDLVIDLLEDACGNLCRQLSANIP